MLTTEPEEITVTFTIKIKVSTVEAKDYWITQASQAAIYAIADLFDSLDGIEDAEIICINDQTKEQVQQQLNTEAGL